MNASLVGTEDAPRLRIAWTERGGPPVVPPSRKGFGSRLIERGLTAQVNARLVLDCHPEGGELCRRGLAGRFPGGRLRVRRNEGPGDQLPIAMPDNPSATTALVVEDEMLCRLEVRDLLEANG